MKSRSRDIDYRAILYGLGRIIDLFPSRVRSVHELRKVSAVPLVESKVLKEMRIRKQNARKLHRALYKIQEGELQVVQTLLSSEMSPLRGQVVRVLRRRTDSEGKQDHLHYIFADHEDGISDMLALSEDWAAVAADLHAAKQQADNAAREE